MWGEQRGIPHADILSRMSAAYLLSLVSVTAAVDRRISLRLVARSSHSHRTLANGLTFLYAAIASRKKPRCAAGVKAGSIDEADDQARVAHLLEHMAFNGLTHFKSGEIVSYLESLGRGSGPTFNAYPLDETCTCSRLHTDRDGIMARGSRR